MVPRKLYTKHQRTPDTVNTTHKTNIHSFPHQALPLLGPLQMDPPLAVNHTQVSPCLFLTFYSHGGASWQFLKTSGSCLHGLNRVLSQSWNHGRSWRDRTSVSSVRSQVPSRAKFISGVHMHLKDQQGGRTTSCWPTGMCRPQPLSSVEPMLPAGKPAETTKFGNSNWNGAKYPMTSPKRVTE